MDRASSRSVTVSHTAATPIAAADGQRVGLLITAPTANRITISERPGVTDGDGLVLAAGQPPLYLSARLGGSYCQRALFAIAATADETVGILEVLCPCLDQPILG